MDSESRGVPIPLGTFEDVLRDSTPLLADIRLELGKGSILRRRHALSRQLEKLVSVLLPFGGARSSEELSLLTAPEGIRCAHCSALLWVALRGQHPVLLRG